MTYCGEGDGCLHNKLPLGSSLSRPVGGKTTGTAIVAIAVVVDGCVLIVVVAVGAPKTFGAEGPLEPCRRRRPLPHQALHLLQEKENTGEIQKKNKMK